MSNHAYRLPNNELTREQLEFLIRGWMLGNRIIFAKFDRLVEPLATFQQHMAKTDQVFGRGAVEASTDVNTSGYTMFPQLTRDTLELIYHLTDAQNSDYAFGVQQALNHYMSASEWTIDLYGDLGVDEEDIHDEIWAMDH